LFKQNLIVSLIFVVLLAAGLIFSLVTYDDVHTAGYEEEEEIADPVSYTTTVEGYGGEMEIEVVFEDDQIADIKVLSHQETERIADPAFEELREAVLAAQSTEVDKVSGATVTSEAYLEAIREILREAGIGEDEIEPEEEAQMEIFTGSAEGYGGEIILEVKLVDGEIIEIEIVEHAETEDIADPAFEDLKEAVISQQIIEVDTISGATITSEAFISALKEALADKEVGDIELVEVDYTESFIGNAEGYGGEMEVEVFVKNDEIVDIKIIQHQETDEIAQPAFEELINSVLETQSVEVDNISGATITSEAFLEAVGEALAQD